MSDLSKSKMWELFGDAFEDDRFKDEEFQKEINKKLHVDCYFLSLLSGIGWTSTKMIGSTLLVSKTGPMSKKSVN